MPKIIMHIAEAPGGVERYLVILLKEMKFYQEYEHVLVCSRLFDTKKFEGLVSDIIVVDEMKNAITIVHDLKAIMHVRKIIKTIKPDYIYCHSSKAGAIGRIADIGIKNMKIYNAHGWSFNIKGLNVTRAKLYEIVERCLSHITDMIVCISEYEKESAINHKICNEDKLVVINNGIDLEEHRNNYEITQRSQNT